MFLSLLAHALLRVFVGGTLFFLGIKHLRDRASVRTIMNMRWPRFAGFFAWYIGFVELLLGVMFVTGCLTQIAAILGGIMALKMLFFKKTFTYPTFPQPIYYVLLLGACFSLFITGAGALAFDLPF